MSDMPQGYVRPYVSYSGSKYSLIKKSPVFRSALSVDGGTLYDICCGTGSVAINGKAFGASKVVALDIDVHLITCMDFLTRTDVDFLKRVLGELNEVEYYELRDMYNSSHNTLALIALQHRSFNSLLRFNKRGDFNAPKGLKDINIDAVANFALAARGMDIRFIRRGIEALVHPFAKHGDRVYVDPPYLLASDPYGNEWNIEKENAMREMLIAQRDAGAKVTMSNVSLYKGVENTDLLSWANTHGFFIYNLDYQYDMWSRAVRSASKSKKTVEIIVTSEEIK